MSEDFEWIVIVKKLQRIARVVDSLLEVFLKMMEFRLSRVFKYYVTTLGGIGYIPKFLYG